MRPFFPVLVIMLLRVPAIHSQVHLTHGTRIDSALPGTLYAGSPNSVKLTGRRLDRASFYALLPQSAKYPVFIATSAVATDLESLKLIQKAYCREDDKCIVGSMPPGNGRVTTERFVAVDLPSDAQTGQYWLLILDSGRNLLGSIPFQVTGADPSNPGLRALQSQGLPDGMRLCPSVGSVQQGSSPAPDPKSADAICNTSFLTYDEVKDNFGSHVADVYYALQIGVANNNQRYDFMLRNITLLLPDGRHVSSRVKRFAQGVAISGKIHDRRNLVVNSLQWGGSVFGGITTFDFIASDAKNAANIFQGLFMDGLRQTFPDSSVENVNRFNNAIFDDQQPTIVPRGGGGKSAAYVIALVPRPHGDHGATDYLGQQIASAIEGEFIQTAQLVELSPQQLTFQPHSVITATADKPVPAIGDKPATGDEILAFTLRNNSGATLHIVSIKAAAETEFKVIPDTCAAKNAAGLFDPKQLAFDLPADSQCGSEVFFEPLQTGLRTDSVVVTTSTDSYKISLSGVGLAGQIQLQVQASSTSSTQSLIDGPNYVFTSDPNKVLAIQASASLPKTTQDAKGLQFVPTIGTVSPTTIDIAGAKIQPATISVSLDPNAAKSLGVKLVDSAVSPIAPARSLILKYTDVPYPCFATGAGVCNPVPAAHADSYVMLIHPSVGGPTTVRISDSDAASGFALAPNAGAPATCTQSGNVITVATADCIVKLSYIMPAAVTTPPSPLTSALQVLKGSDLIYSFPLTLTPPAPAAPAITSINSTALSAANGGTITITGTGLKQVSQIRIAGATNLDVNIADGGSDTTITSRVITKDMMTTNGLAAGQSYPLLLIPSAAPANPIDVSKKVSVN